MNADLLPYQKKAIDCLNQICDYTGKKILEIGVDPSFSVAKELLERGAQKVICINNKQNLNYKKFSDRLELVNMDARKMEFESENFDVVFGVSILEHLIDLDKVLTEIDKVLHNKGFVYLHGGALWPCSLGHHLWVHVDGIRYEFNGNNPVPDWYHLIYNKIEMKEYLESKNICSNHAEKIVNMIYDDPVINRYYYEDYIRFFNESNLMIVKINESIWSKPQSRDIQNLLIKADSGEFKNHTFGEVEVIFKK